MSWGRRSKVIAVGVLALSAVALTSVWTITHFTGTKWPPGSDEERLARAMQRYDRWCRRDPFSELLRRFEVMDPEFEWIKDVAQEIYERDGERAIPLLIGVIEADNSSATICGIGYHILGELTNYEQNPFHDGAWWRRWWERQKHEYPAEVRAIPIPQFDKTGQGRRHKAFPDDIDTLQAKLRLGPALVVEWANYHASGRTSPQPQFDIGEYAGALREHNDPHAIPYLIGLIAADPSGDAGYRVGYFGLGFDLRKPWSLTDVDFGESHDGAWWQHWWQDNKAKYAPDVQAIEIPDFQRPLTFAWHEPSDEEKLADVRDIPAVDTTVSGNERMRYFLVGPRPAVEPPRAGYKLVVVLPGGVGEDRFQPLVRRLHKYAMSDEFLVVQPVAHSQNTALIWPTHFHEHEESCESLPFFTEDFVEAVIRDVSERHHVDRRFVFTLAWDSSGAAAYAIALHNPTAVTGSYIVMHGCPADWSSLLSAAKGRLFLLNHELLDSHGTFTGSEQTRQQLTEAGAIVRSTARDGTIARHALDYDQVSAGLKWLVSQAESRGN